MSEKTADLTFHPDRPIHSVSEDRLGFGILASNLATSIKSNASNDGFVIGIEGKWGCGKSSIVNLLRAELEREKNLSVIQFAPWIVGDRDNMVSALISSISHAIDKIETQNDPIKKKVNQTTDLANKMRGYGAELGRRLTPFAQVASAIGIPGTETAAKVLDTLAGIADAPFVPLIELKEDLTASLKKLGHTLVVIVDDLDRLEPLETVEIMRLIRAVGDFPNVIYVLCYDKSILTGSLQTALNIESGGSFLQKIVQASFAVPEPEEFDLRRWLNVECLHLYQTVTGNPLDSEVEERLQAVCDSQGEQISTPREINLVLNSLRLCFPAIANKVDYSDLCWLHIVKIKNENFYRWIEDYLNNFSIVFRGEGTMSDKSRKKMAKELLIHMQISDVDDEDDYSSARSLWTLKEILPGISTHTDKTKIGNIILNTESLTDESLSNLETNFRLASPAHYRLYFAFAQPSGILDDTKLSEIISAANAGNSLINEFKKMNTIKRAQGGTMYELMLDRLKRQNIEKFNERGVIKLTQALVETIDDGLRKEVSPDFFNVRSIGRNGRQLLGKILSVIDNKKRVSFVKNIFENGKSIGWLVSDIMGDELFNHGRLGDRIKEERQLLTEEELDIAIQVINGRLQGMKDFQILTVPNPLTFFYRWQQSSEDAKKYLHSWIARRSKTDAGFLQLLDLFRSYVVSSNRGAYRPLNASVVENFFGDFEEIKKRLSKILKNTKTSRNGKHLSAAEKLLEAIEDAK